MSNHQEESRQRKEEQAEASQALWQQTEEKAVTNYSIGDSRKDGVKLAIVVQGRPNPKNKKPKDVWSEAGEA